MKTIYTFSLATLFTLIFFSSIAVTNGTNPPDEDPNNTQNLDTELTVNPEIQNFILIKNTSTEVTLKWSTSTNAENINYYITNCDDSPYKESEKHYPKTVGKLTFSLVEVVVAMGITKIINESGTGMKTNQNGAKLTHEHQATVSNLSPGEDYTFRVVGEAPDGSKVYSRCITKEVDKLNPIIADLTLTENSPTAVTLNWNTLTSSKNVNYSLTNCNNIPYRTPSQRPKKTEEKLTMSLVDITIAAAMSVIISESVSNVNQDGVQKTAYEHQIAVSDLSPYEDYSFRMVSESIDGYKNYSECITKESIYTYVPDDNFESYLEGIGLDDDISQNNYVLTSNIEPVQQIWISNRGISDLTGIEDFSSLKILGAYHNNITSVDLSNLTTLEQIYLDNNALTSIDFSNNPNIWKLALGHNQLSGDIDLSGLPKLTWVGIDYNNFTSINMKNGNNTNVTAFWASNLPYLNCITVDDRGYSANNWPYSSGANFILSPTSCGDYTFIPDDAFENYLENRGNGDDIPNNNYVLTSKIESIQQLWIGNLNINNLTGIENFSNLKILGAYHNNITSVDLSNLAILEQIYLDNNALTAVDFSNNPNIWKLALGHNQLSGELDLSDLTQLTWVGVDYNDFTEINMQNGNNTNVTAFWASNLPNLSCITVDNIVYSSNNWPYTSGATFIENSFDCNSNTRTGEFSSFNDFILNSSHSVFENTTTIHLDRITEDTFIHISNINGQTLYQNHFSNNASFEFGSNLPSGLYFIKATTGASTKSIKIIKSN